VLANGNGERSVTLDTTSKHLTARQAAFSCLSRFDPVFPGRGLDAHASAEVLDHAMAYGLYLSSVSLMGMEPEAINAARWLRENAIRKDDGFGWGLPFAWRAFGRDPPNPVDTIYGITTALAVQGLLYAHTRIGVPAALQTATEALDRYKGYASTTDAGLFFWYSDQPEDAQNVHNVNAMLAAQYQHAGTILGRDDFKRLAKDAVSDLTAHIQVGENGEFWSYGDRIERPNDAVHAAYTVLGLSAVEGPLDASSKHHRAVQYLRQFFRDGKAYEFVRHPALNQKNVETPARPWGPGMLLFAGSELSDPLLIDLAFPFAANARIQSFYPRQMAHIALGLAKCADYYDPERSAQHDTPARV
jgi:hypothetical protein